MMKGFKRSAVLAVACLAVSVASARAADVVVVNVPFPFVVRGVAMPAGEYMVQRVDSEDPTVLAIRGMDAKRTSTAITFSTPATGQDPAGDTPSLTFKRHENGYWLSSVWESKSEGRTVTGR
jgi:hypothetical protein